MLDASINLSENPYPEDAMEGFLTCWPPDDSLYFANAGLNIASDIAIVLLPLPSVWKLQIPRKDKISLIVIIVLGGLWVSRPILQ